MQKELSKLVEIAGPALEAEDRYLLGSISANRAAYPDGNGGLLRVNNERYYQFIVARALMSSFPFAVVPELNRHDLVLKYPGSNSNWFAAVEMKRWMSGAGESEIPGMIEDLKKLRSCGAESALMLVFSANKAGKTNENLAWLSARLDIDASSWETYSFPTFNTEGESVDFWVAGFKVQ